MLTPELMQSKFELALPYDAYVNTGKPEHQDAWHAFEKLLTLDAAQERLLQSFTRRLNVLAISGTWCGDCSKQLPILRRFEAVIPDRLTVRFLDRDEHMDLASQVKICGGARVPVVLILNEDFDFLALEGDRVLARYRALAARQLGASCELPTARVDYQEIRATLADWLEVLEKAQLMCRLSTKLRERYRD